IRFLQLSGKLLQLLLLLGRSQFQDWCEGRGYGDARDVDLIEVVEKGKEAVEVALGNRIVLVVVTASATHGEAQERCRRRFDAIGDVFCKAFLGNRPAFHVNPVVEKVAGSYPLLDTRVGKEIARELMADKAIVGQVIIEGIDDPVAPGPGTALE